MYMTLFSFAIHLYLLLAVFLHVLSLYIHVTQCTCTCMCMCVACPLLYMQNPKSCSHFPTKMLLIHWSLVSHATNSPLRVNAQNSFVPVQTSSLASVNAHGTVPSSTVLHGTVPHKRGGPDWYRTVSILGVNNSVPLASSCTVIFGLFMDVHGVFPQHVYLFNTFYVDDRKLP